MSNRTPMLLSTFLALTVLCSLNAETPAQDAPASTQNASNKDQTEEQTSSWDKSVMAGQDYPDGFDRSRLTPPAINTVEEFLQFTEKVRAIPYEEIIEAKRLKIYYRELMFAKNRAIVAAADDLLAKTADPKDLFRIHTVKFKELRGLRRSSSEERKAFEAYSRDLKTSTDAQLRSIPAAQDLVMNTVYTAMLDATEEQHMTLVKMLFDHLDKYGVNEPAAKASESIYRMYPAEKYPKLRPVLIRGLAERFEKASEENPELREMTTRLRSEAAKLEGKDGSR